MDIQSAEPNIFINQGTPKSFRGKLSGAKIIFIILGAVIVIEVIIAGVVLLRRQSSSPATSNTSTVSTPSSASSTQSSSPNGMIILEASKQEIKVGENLEVTINLDTGGKITDGTDVVLKFDTNILETTTASVKPGTIYPDYPIAKVLDSEIRISGISSLTGGTFQGKGVLAKIIFKGKAAGKASLILDHTPGKTVDSNIVESSTGEDLLKEVKNLEVTVK